jgi:hypothetical protein
MSKPIETDLTGDNRSAKQLPASSSGEKPSHSGERRLEALSSEVTF